MGRACEGLVGVRLNQSLGGEKVLCFSRDGSTVYWERTDAATSSYVFFCVCVLERWMM